MLQKSYLKFMPVTDLKLRIHVRHAFYRPLLNGSTVIGTQCCAGPSNFLNLVNGHARIGLLRVSGLGPRKP